MCNPHINATMLCLAITFFCFFSFLLSMFPFYYVTKPINLLLLRKCYLEATNYPGIGGMMGLLIEVVLAWNEIEMLCM